MSASPVRLKGSTQFVRTHGDRRLLLQHETELVMHDRAAVIRVTSDATNLSEAVTITDRRALYSLQQIDAALLRTARRHEAVTPRFKRGRRRRSSRVEVALEPGWMWCPDCLGCVERSTTCDRCEGRRVVPQEDADA